MKKNYLCRFRSNLIRLQNNVGKKGSIVVLITLLIFPSWVMAMNNKICSFSEKTESVKNEKKVFAKESNLNVTDNQQQRKISGNVADKNGEPLVGVTIMIKGTDIGTTTDYNGDFKITITDDNAVLVFSFIGFVTQEISTSDVSMLSVKLEQDIAGLDEVVVIGYGVVKKSNITGAISQVKAVDMENRTVVSPTQALQGKTAGVQVIQTSGAPGKSPAIRVRGYSSNSDMSPLYVVDGVIMSDISGYDPNDIESMEVLKDAASAAIYGAQAGNGVVLVTTKKGSKSGEGFGNINYDYQYSLQSLYHIPEMLNANEYIEYMLEGGKIKQDQVDTYWDGVTDTDWTKVAFGNSAMKRHSLSFNGANKKGSYYLSMSNLSNDGIVVGDADVYNRLTGMVNADYNVKKWLKVGTNSQIEKWGGRSVSEGTEYGSLLASVLSLDPLTPNTYTADNLSASMQSLLGDSLTLLQNENGEYYAISDFYASENIHPLIMRDRSISKSNGFNVNGSVFADFKPIEGLTITSRLGYRLSLGYSNTYNNDYYGSAQASNRYVNLNSSSSGTVYYQWDNFVNYLKDFGKHEISAMAGHSFVKTQNAYVAGGLTANDENAVLKDDPELFGYLNFASASATKTNSGQETRSASESYFGRIGYTYDGKYISQFSLRADAFDLSKLPATNRWGYFPSASLAWIASRESFMNSISNIVNFLKVRGSYGINGSIGPLNGYLYSSDMSSYHTYSYTNDNFGTNGFNTITGIRPSTMGNNELSWETSKQLDLGFDSRFLDDRLSLNFDFFNKTTDGLLVTGITPSLIVGGVTSPINAGTVENHGIELELGWNDQIGGFQYSINGNIATLKNKVTYLDPSLIYITGSGFHTGTVTIFEQGAEVWHFYGYQFEGVDPETGEAIFKDQLTVDTNSDGVMDEGDGVINEADKTNIGCAIPDYTYGITVSMKYRSFDFLLFGTGSEGNDIFQGLTRTDRMTGNRIKSEFYDDRWKAPGDITNIPAAGAAMKNYLYSDAMVKDGSYFKIKQIQLGYNLPENLINKLKLSGLRIYGSLDDYFTFTKYSGFDPEASSAGTGSSQGIDKGVYPISKKVVFGLNVKF